MNKERIHKLVIKPCDIDQCHGSWQINSNDNLIICNDCKSALFYVKLNWGVVVDDFDYGVMWNKSNRVYSVREVGLTVYCAECGDFIEQYSKYFYPEDKTVMWDLDFDELDEDERAELQVCLNQYNQTRKFESRYKSNIFIELKKKLNEYEKKYPDVKKKEKSNKSRSSKKRKKAPEKAEQGSLEKDKN